ncbi:methyltransferase domain-containing protein [Pseudoduganella danionis]|uniref:O-linked N-acetylglucosamine transferase family protein n=1 Tax=Pseudoduganella danionis TaxID=1890295 RepID=UPI0035B2B297
MHAHTPALPLPSDTSPLGTVMALALQGSLGIGDLFNAAAVLQESGQLQSAIALYRSWLAHTPSPLAYAARFNLAVVLSTSGQDAEAETLLREAIAQNPDFVEGRLNLGTLLERVGRPDEALAMWHSILNEVKPDIRNTPALHVQTLNNLGRLLEIRKRYPEAEAMLAQSLHVDPQQNNVMTHWVHLRQKQCEWPVYSGLEHIATQDLRAGTSALAMLSASDDAAEQLAAARRFVHEKVNAAVAPLTGEYGYAHRRLRIGYLSSDFCSHAVSILTAELYELHDRSQFEVYAFSWSREDGSPIRARVVRAMDHYIRIDAMTDEQAAYAIREREIDILVDLHGLTLGARPNILAYRPAPVQLTYLGFPGSTGLPGVDYVIADEFLITPEMARHFTEKPLYLPDTFQINDRQRQIAPTPSRASVGLPDEVFVFCSFNNNFKFTPELFAIWMNILRRVPDSVLWLVADYQEVRHNLCRYAEQAGIDPARLIFNTRAVPAEYLARYQLADLFLDTYPFNAGTTASDALWAGLPLLTCAGQTFSSRMAGSLLRAVDLPQLITYSFADYEEKAVALAHDRPAIAAMKQQLSSNRLSCALFDSPRFVRHLETALRSIVKPAAPHAADALALEQIPIVTVSYNGPDLIAALLRSLRQFCPNPVYVIDGSSPDKAEQIGAIVAAYANVQFIPFGYNIHHGPGMAWAANNLDLHGPVLFLDSDVEILRADFLATLAAALKPGMYGVGHVGSVDEHGQDDDYGAVAYLHPACMLCDVDVMRQWPMPIKHGAPMIQTMVALARAGQQALVGDVAWVGADFGAQSTHQYIKHLWRGTVNRTGGYHYGMSHETSNVNQIMLAFAAAGASKVVDIGCGDGSFAAAFRGIQPVCNYTGVELQPALADQARPHCDFVFCCDIEQPLAQLYPHVEQADLWILGDVLGALRDPWAVLRQIRRHCAPKARVVLSVRNAQYWARLLRFAIGDLRYGPGTALEADELRLFSRSSALDLLQQCGFRVIGGAPVTREAAPDVAILPLLGQLAASSGYDRAITEQDALAYEFVLVAEAV